MKTHLSEHIITAVQVILLLIFVLFPFSVMLSISLKAPDEQFTSPYLIPKRPTGENYLHVFGKGSMFVRYFINSFSVSWERPLCYFRCSFSSYGYARLQFPGKIFFNLLLLSQLFPLAAIIVPLYRIMSQAGLIDTFSSLIIGYLAFSVPVEFGC